MLTNHRRHFFCSEAGKPGGETLPDDIAALIEKWKVLLKNLEDK